MGMKLTLKKDDLIVETDYGGGSIDQKYAQQDRERLKSSMRDAGMSSVEAPDYYEAKKKIEKRLIEKGRRQKGYGPPLDIY